MNSLKLKSFAKLNLFLAVYNKRPDDYHRILTLFERIDLYDEIILKTRSNQRIRLISRHPDLPKGKKNLAFRAAELLKKDLGLKYGLEIIINKRIPLAAGLGGGSSNAACVLLGLNRLWGLGLSRKRLASYGRRLGADVGFFLYQTAFALGQGRGDNLKVVRLPPRFWHVLVVPRLEVSTQRVYEKLDSLQKRKKPILHSLRHSRVGGPRALGQLTNYPADVKILILRLRERNLALVRQSLVNQMEMATLALYPQLEKIKNRLARLGLKEIAMSGSGPAMFVLVASRKEGERLQRQLVRDRHWQTFLVRTF